MTSAEFLLNQLKAFVDRVTFASSLAKTAYALFASRGWEDQETG